MKLNPIWIVSLVAACFLLYMGITLFSLDKSSLMNLRKLKQEIASTNAKNDSLQRELDDRLDKIEHLKTDTFYIEYVARTKFGMSKPGESAFQFILAK